MTPLMQQYWDIKSAHPDKILLFRMGDFFEMFYKDAEIAAPVIGIALTSRNKKSADETPMCGVPHHSIAGPINKLLQSGYRVAICDQIEDPKFAKGIVKRAVTRILSPGVVFDPDTLDHLKPNYICSLDNECLSFLETTTGEAFYYSVREMDQRRRLLEVLAPVEVVVGEKDKERWKEELAQVPHAIVSVYDGVSSEAGVALPESAARLLAYAIYMQGEGIRKILQRFERREMMQWLEMSATVVRHLEIFETYKGEAHGSLFHAVNRCKTSSGARLLKNWLSFPLRTREAIERRLEQVQYWHDRMGLMQDLRSTLAQMGDIQRRLGKIGNPSCNPRDLKALSESLQSGLKACAIASHQVWEPGLVEAADAVVEKIEATLVDEPSVNTKNGHMIREGVNPSLDEYIQLSTNSQQLILELEMREREKTGIASLKVRYNNVFGYYIEITNTHKDKVPLDRYQRKQTLANAERFITPELQEIESKVLTAQTRRIELELEIFDDLKAFVLERTQALLELSRLWAELDVFSSLAWLAHEQRYVRPTFSQAGDLCLKASRHPVVEQALSASFVANTIEIEANQCLLLTGPNMAGKSTLMRQVAVAAILAQMGSFVPAEEAAMPVFDRIFTRIGASDYLAEGLSTFMVEMKESAEMLKQATPNSLVILDEVGRGTSTYDGMSLAQAILEFLLEESLAMTLFATHYHELTRLESVYPQLNNAHMAIHEKGGEISFLHTLVKGPANKSYGIQVARLAGLPTSVTKRAWQILKELESRAPMDHSPQLSLLEMASPETPESSVENEATETHPVLEDLRALPIQAMTPLEALNQIAKWQKSLSDVDFN